MAIGDRAIQRRLDQLTEQAEAEYSELRLDETGRFESGGLPAMAPAERRLLDEQGEPTGRLTVAMLSAEEFASRIEKLTGRRRVVEDGDTRVASTRATAPADLPVKGAAEIDGTDYRVQSLRAPAVGGPLTVRLLLPDAGTAPTGRTRWPRPPPSSASSCSPSSSRSPSHGACSRRSSVCWWPRSGSAPATSR